MAEAPLKQPADLYISLAFAAADMLFEIDQDGRITYAVGAAMSLLGRPARKLTEMNLLDLVTANDHARAERALSSMARGERVRNIILEVDRPEKGPAFVAFSGYAQPDREGKLVAVMAHSTRPITPPTKSTPSGLMDKDSFAAKARELIQAPEADSSGYRLTLLEVPEMDTLRAKVGAEAADVFAGKLGERLRGLSAGGEAAGQLSDTKYGIIHSGSVDPDFITQAVSEAAHEVPGVDLAPPKAASLVLDVAELPGPDAARALAYTLNAFANNEEGGSLDDIAANLQPRLSQTVAEMRAVRSVIENAEFDMVYQPIVDLWTNVIHHFEALVRFHANADRSPYETITFAEDTGLIGDLDIKVLQRVVSVMVSPAGSNPALRFAVNLSGRSLGDGKIMTQIRQILRGVPQLAKRLLIEITESAAIADLEAANAVVQEIRKMGFEVCLDDFGAGSAAFHYLRALKVDHVKIDGSYVKDCMKSNENMAFIKSMVGLCTDLNISTIAEYVEDAPTAAILKLMKVRYGQGWHFGKPHNPDLSIAEKNIRVWAPPGSEWRKGLLYFKG